MGFGNIKYRNNGNTKWTCQRGDPEYTFNRCLIHSLIQIRKIIVLTKYT